MASTVVTVPDCSQTPYAGQQYEISTALPPWLRQTSVLTHRTFLNNLRNVGVFWVRLAMYVMLCLVSHAVPASSWVFVRVTKTVSCATCTALVHTGIPG